MPLTVTMNTPGGWKQLPDFSANPNTVQIYSSDGVHAQIIQRSDLLVSPLSSIVTSAPSPPGPVITNLWTGSVTFNANYFGCQGFSYNGPVSIPAGMSLGIYRASDDNCLWSVVQTSTGTPNPATNLNAARLATLDTIVNDCYALGVDVILVMHSCPAWTGITDTTSYAAWINFCLTRYGTKVKYYEGWNEPNVSGSWPGTMTQLVTWQQTLWNTVQTYNTANSTSIKVISPSFSGATAISTDTLNMTGFNTAGGYAYCDIVGFHAYAYSTIAANYIGPFTFDRNVLGSTSSPATGTVNKFLQTNAIAKPLWVTEVGSSTPSYRSLVEEFVIAAIQGAQRLCHFSWQDPSLGAMNFNQANLGVTAWNNAVALLSGRTLTAVNQLNTGDLGLIFSAGSPAYGY